MLDLFWPFWQFEPFLTILERLVYSGPFGSFWTVWTAFDHFGPFGSFWTVWFILDYLDRSVPVLRFWNLLDGPDWSKVVQNVPEWFMQSRMILILIFCLPDICQYWYTTALFMPVRSTPKSVKIHDKIGQNALYWQRKYSYFNVYKGRVWLSNRMNFRKNSKRPLTPPLIFGKLCCIFL